MQRYFILSSPSGGGKTTLAKRLLTAQPALALSVSACTRKARSGEQDGIDYYFMDQKTFEHLITQNQFIEHEQVYPGRYYGTLQREIDRLCQAQKHIVFDVDVEGAQRLKKHFGPAALSVFILPPSLDALAQRLHQRGTETPQNIQYRLERAKKEIAARHHFDHTIENQNIDTAFDVLHGLVQSFLPTPGANTPAPNP